MAIPQHLEDLIINWSEIMILTKSASSSTGMRLQRTAEEATCRWVENTAVSMAIAISSMIWMMPCKYILRESMLFVYVYAAADVSCGQPVCSNINSL